MMVRDNSINKLYAFARAGVFALTLAGCGGGGGTAAVEEEPPAPMPSAQEMCEADGGRYNADGSCTSAAALKEEMDLSEAQSAAMAAYMAAMAAVNGAKDPVAAANAQMYAAMAMEASDAAAMATTSEMAMEYQMKAEMNRDMAMKAAMERGLGTTKLANKIINQSDIDNAVLEGKPADKPASNATRVGAALGVAGMADAVATVVDLTATPPAGSISQGGAVSATASYGASGPSITVTADTALTVFDAVTKGEDPVSLTTRGGWMGAELVGSDADSMTYAIAYTDIQAPATMDTYVAADAPTYATTALQGHLTNDPEITGDVATDGSDFAAMYNFDPDDNLPPVAGMFDCPTPTPTNGCSISVKDGVVESIQGYIFRMRTGVGNRKVNDADYLAWGVWLTVPNARPTADTPNAATSGAFASGNQVFEVRAALKGTATYNGVANGLYSAGGMVESFEADAMLEANFGGTVAADATAATAEENSRTLLGVVTGMISNIKAGGMDMEGSLELKRAPVVAATAETDTDPAETTTGFMGATGGTLAGRTLSGEWGGQFYGPNKASGKGIETEYPTTAAGTFGADSDGTGTDIIRILGSFGTWKAE